MSTFLDRSDAGKKLAQELLKFKDQDPIVFGLLRGGIAVAYEVAKALKCPLEPFIVRKLGMPGNSELAIGAMTEGSIKEKETIVWYESILRLYGIPQKILNEIKENAQKEIDRRVKFFREGHPIPSLEGKTVILVDDGLATGMTALAAIKAFKNLNPDKLVLAVPTGAAETVAKLQDQVDELVCLVVSEEFFAVGQWYQDFTQVLDEDVLKFLKVKI